MGGGVLVLIKILQQSKCNVAHDLVSSGAELTDDVHHPGPDALILTPQWIVPVQLSKKSDSLQADVGIPDAVGGNLAQQLADTPLEQRVMATGSLINECVEILQLSSLSQGVSSTDSSVPGALLTRPKSLLHALENASATLHQRTGTIIDTTSNLNDTTKGLLQLPKSLENSPEV